MLCSRRELPFPPRQHGLMTWAAACVRKRTPEAPPLWIEHRLCIAADVSTDVSKKGLNGLVKRSLPYDLEVSQTSLTTRLVYPIDSVRRRMMMEAGRPQRMYTSSFHCIQSVLATEGFRGFYRGLSANLLRGVGTSALLVMYDEIRVMFSRI